MRVLLVFLFSLLIQHASLANTSSWQWAKNTGCSTPGGGSEGWLIKTNRTTGNTVVAGYYWGDSLCWGNNTFYNPYNPYNNLQTIIGSYDSLGNLLWTKASKNGQSRPIAMSLDNEGNILLFGYYTTPTVEIDNVLLANSGFNTTDSLNNKCYYVVKLQADGKILWALSGLNNFYPDGDHLHPGGICIDNANNIYVASTFRSATFITATDTLKNSNTAANTNDIFLLKISPNGSIIKSYSFGAESNEYVTDLAFGVGNQLYLTGYFKAPQTTFGRNNLFTDNQSLFLVSLDTSAQVVWAQTAKGKNLGTTLCTDRKDMTLLGGGFYNYIELNNERYNSSVGGSFIYGFNAGGAAQLIKIVTPTGNTSACCQLYNIAADTCNHIWFTGLLDRIRGIQLSDSVVLYAPTTNTSPMYIAGINLDNSIYQATALTAGGGNNTGLGNIGLSIIGNGDIMVGGDFQTVDSMMLGTQPLYMSNNADGSMFTARYHTGTDCSIPTTPNYTNEVKIFPIPANAELSITFDGIITSNAALSIFDLAGRRYLYAPITNNNFTINTTYLASGIYQLHMRLNDRKTVIKTISILH